MKNPRVIFYIDGFNLYYGIDDLNISKYKWLDIQKLSENLCGTNQQLIKVKYFTSRVRNDPAKIRRQNTYLQAVETLPLVEIFYGSYILTSKDFNCAQCACLNTVDIPKEKRTDINIASQLFSDFYYDNCDTARIISGDSDLVPAIKVTKSIFQNKKIKFYFPPKRFSGEIKKVCDSSKMLPVNILDNCLLPDQLMNKFGYVIKRPVKWY